MDEQKQKTKKPRKKMSNKLFGGIWGSLLALLMAGIITINVVLLKYSSLITRSLGHQTVATVNLDNSGDSDYFKSAFATEADLLAHETEISRQIEAEGIVLVKNDQNALPLQKGAKISIFGQASTQFRYGGGGSGAIDETNVQSVKEAFTQEGFDVNTDYDKQYLVEKASVELCGFGKTRLLLPGETETVALTVPKEELRAYDRINARTYIVDAGTYYFTVADNAHDAVNNILAAKGCTTEDGMDDDGNAAMTAFYVQQEMDTTTYAVDSTTGTAISNQFDYSSMTYYDSKYVYLTRSDWDGTWPSFYGKTDKKGNHTMKASDQLLQDSQENHYADDPNAVMPTTGSGAGIKLITMRGKAYDDPAWENVLDCLTVEEMMNMVRLGGWQTAQLLSISKPVSNDQDGPAGISDELISGSAHCMGYPIAVLLASTWNQELVEQMGGCISEDGLKSGVQGWYAPGAGTHRTPYGGRNFEYYSEDGLLSGKICAAEVRGAQSKGMYVYLKHLVLNDQEDRRYGIATFCQEQALRELYMTPFEICVKEADAHGMMAAFDSIGGIWCGANKDLLEDVLRGEWGFRGIVVTDYATANGGYMWIDMGLQNGGDLWLNSDKTVYWIDGIENNATLVNGLRRASHNILYTVVNSAAMNGFSEKTEIRNVLPEWQIWMICADAATLVVTVAGVLLIVRRCRKNCSNIQVAQIKEQV